MSLQRKTKYPIDPMFTCRWSPRAFNGEPMDQQTLMSLFEAARWSPSSFNAQPWRFIYAHRDTPGWASLFGSLNEFNRGWADRAAVLVAVLSRTRWTPPGKTQAQEIASHSFDAGAAWASLAFQATLLGWHAHAMGGFDAAQLRQALGVPAHYAVEAVVALGWRTDAQVLSEPLQRREVMSQRLPLEQIVAEGHFTFREATPDATAPAPQTAPA